MFKTWTPKEEEDLLVEYRQQMPMEEIATKHNRSKKAIEVRLQDIAVKMHLDNKPDDEILTSTGVNKETLLKRKESKEKEREKKGKEREQQMLNKVAEIYNFDTKSTSSNETIVDQPVNDLRLEVKELRLEIKEMRLMFKELQSLITELSKK